MNILQIMGCTSDQYASMESYLVRKAAYCKGEGHELWVAYENKPRSQDFCDDMHKNGGHVLQLKCLSATHFAFYQDLRAIIKKYEIDVVHSYFTPTCHYVMMACSIWGIKMRFRTSANLPYSIFMTGHQRSVFSESLFKLRQRLLAFFPIKIICRSDGIRQELVKIGVPPKKIAVASGGTDTSRYYKNKKIGKSLRADLGISEDTFVIGTACRLVPVKNLKTLLHAVALLLKKKKNFQVLLAGNGPEYGPLNELIGELAIGETVKLLGHRDDLQNLLNALDVFVQPSWSEGMSNSILEAMACEVPIVVSDIPPNLEIFAKAQERKLLIGEIFKPDSKEMLSEKLRYMMGCNNLPEIGRNGRHIVEDFFSLDARIEKEFSIYEEQV